MTASLACPALIEALWEMRASATRQPWCHPDERLWCPSPQVIGGLASLGLARD